MQLRDMKIKTKFLYLRILFLTEVKEGFTFKTLEHFLT